MQSEIKHRPFSNFFMFFSKSTRLAFRNSIRMSILATALAGLSFIFLQPVIPIFYSLAQPEKQLQPKIWIFLYPALAWMIALSHFAILNKTRDLAIPVQKIFAWTTTGIIILLNILLIRTLFLLF